MCTLAPSPTGVGLVKSKPGIWLGDLAIPIKPGILFYPWLARGAKAWLKQDRLNSHGAFSVFESNMVRIWFEHVSSTIILK